jgi:hypothetical protein
MKGAAVLFVLATAICSIVGAVVVAIHGHWSYDHSIAWALWIGGCLVVLLVGQSGSTTRMAGESRLIVGGRFVTGSDIPMPQSPLAFIPIGILVIAVGVGVYLL